MAVRPVSLPYVRTPHAEGTPLSRLVSRLAAAALIAASLAAATEAMARPQENRGHVRYSCWRWTHHGWVNICYR